MGYSLIGIENKVNGKCWMPFGFFYNLVSVFNMLYFACRQT
jgi:hypothetical protein